jgi:ATP phosphoribosyltransferase
VEIAPNIGLADAIVDIVSSGSTLFKNNLKEVEIIYKSVLVVSPKVTQMFKTNRHLKIQNRISSKSVDQNILMNVPNDKIEWW